MQPRRNVVQHLIPWDAHVISIQVENAALELSALGAAVHIPLEVDIQMLFPRTRLVTEWARDINITDLIFQNKAREAYACYPRLSTIKQVVWLL